MDIYRSMWNGIEATSCSEDITFSGINYAAKAATIEAKRLMKLAYEAGVKSMEEGVEIKWTCFEDWIIRMQTEELDGCLTDMEKLDMKYPYPKI